MLQIWSTPLERKNIGIWSVVSSSVNPASDENYMIFHKEEEVSFEFYLFFNQPLESIYLSIYLAVITFCHTVLLVRYNYFHLTVLT